MPALRAVTKRGREVEPPRSEAKDRGCHEDDGAPSYTIEEVEGATGCLRLGGRLTVDDAPSLWQDLQERVGSRDEVTFDLADAENVDLATLGLLSRLSGDPDRLRDTFAHVPPHIEKKLELLEHHPIEGGAAEQGEEKRSRLDRAEGKLAEKGEELRMALGFFGSLLRDVPGAIARPGSVRWRDLPRLAQQVGASAVPIVLMVNGLAGLMIAFEMAGPLIKYGQRGALADAVGIGTARHMAPFMTALMVTGRSGAAFAAELGTMRSEGETDALEAMGIDPLRYLVLPRVVAIVVAMPLLTALGNVASWFGGLVVAEFRLDIAWWPYVERIREVVDVEDYAYGLVKSVVFGFIVALVACQRGLATEGGASAVGRSTTSSVVLTIFFLVLTNALFSIGADYLGV